MEIHFYHDSVEKFLQKLDAQTLAKSLRTLDLLEIYGSKLSLPHSRALGDGLFELRIKAKQQVRLIYGFFEGEVIILNAFIKKTQKMPSRHLALARKRSQSLKIHNIYVILEA